MAIYPADVELAKSSLWQDEVVQVTATERRVGPGGSLINPTSIVITDKRILIINKTTLGLRKDIESIPFNRISSVRVENGFISCSVYLRVSGYTSSGEQGFLKPGEQEGELPGLRKLDAKAIADYIERKIVGASPMSDPDIGPDMPTQVQPSQKTKMQQKSPSTGGGASAGGYVFCTKCGARNSITSKFCASCGAQLTK